jgi:hypothetical protein
VVITLGGGLTVINVRQWLDSIPKRNSNQQHSGDVGILTVF